MDLDPAAIMAEHEPEPSITDAKGTRHGWWCNRCDEWSSDAEKFCPPYRLAEALAASEAKVAVLEDDRDEWQRVAKAYLSCVAALNAPAADQ